MSAEVKLCECGCGQPAPIATYTLRKRGYIAGQPTRFICGHNYSKGYGTNVGKVPAEYKAYGDAKYRCTNPRMKAWKNYGGRGIRFLFTSFDQFMAELGPRPSPDHSLDRIDNDGDYAPGNVRWATQEDQHANRRCTKKKPSDAPPLYELMAA